MGEGAELDGMVEGGGFCTTPVQESRFVTAVLERRYGAPEIPRGGGLVTGVAAVACALWAWLVIRQGWTDLGQLLGFYAAILGAFAVARYQNHRSRSRPDAPAHPDACHAGDEGLTPALAEGETVQMRLAIHAPIRTGFRRLSAGVQLFWGCMISGLPIATVGAPGGEVAGGLLVWTAFFTLAGALVVGRGVRDLFALGPARVLVLTEERVVAMAAPGAARSLPIAQLIHRPVVVQRGDGTTTLGLDLRRLISAGMLPLRGLWGSDGLAPEEAERWVEAVLANRARQVTEAGPSS